MIGVERVQLARARRATQHMTGCAKGSVLTKENGAPGSAGKIGGVAYSKAVWGKHGAGNGVGRKELGVRGRGCGAGPGNLAVLSSRASEASVGIHLRLMVAGFGEARADPDASRGMTPTGNTPRQCLTQPRTSTS